MVGFCWNAIKICSQFCCSLNGTLIQLKVRQFHTGVPIYFPPRAVARIMQGPDLVPSQEIMMNISLLVQSLTWFNKIFAMYSKTDISQYIFISHGNFGRLCQTRRPCLKTADQQKQKKNLVFYKKTILLSFRFLCWSWFVRHNPYVPSWIGGSLIILFSGVHNQKPQCWWNDWWTHRAS